MEARCHYWWRQEGRHSQSDTYINIIIIIIIAIITRNTHTQFMFN